jgi:hypothetical protein
MAIYVIRRQGALRRVIHRVWQRKSPPKRDEAGATTPQTMD